MTANRRLAVLLAVLLGTAFTYVVVLGTCLGSEPGSTLGTICSAVGPLVKAPFLYLAPSLNSRYLGIDSALILVVLNSAVWGVAAACLVRLALREGRPGPAGAAQTRPK